MESLFNMFIIYLGNIYVIEDSGHGINNGRVDIVLNGRMALRKPKEIKKW
jgi:2,4-dienoyl-CoA reductase-like NADH-dependent reductase (Old Yellow Enzyme family)